MKINRMVASHAGKMQFLKEKHLKLSNLIWTLTFLFVGLFINSQPALAGNTEWWINWNTAQTNPIAVTTADFNKDGRLDYAVANYGSNSITVFIQNNNGTFPGDDPTKQAALHKSVNPSGYSLGPRGIAAGDFNNDSYPDLVTANNTGTMTVFINNRNNNFYVNDYNVGFYSTLSAVAAADFDRDGKIDLAITRESAPSAVFFLRGNGNGTFQHTGGSYTDFYNGPSFATGFQPQEVIATDINKDSKMDLITANSGASSVSVLLGNGYGSFTKASEPVAGGKPYSVAVGDFNKDSIPDLAVATYSTFYPQPAGVTVLTGNGNGTFKAGIAYTNKDGTYNGINGYYTFGVTTGDYDGNGHVDIAAVCKYGNLVSLWMNNGAGGFTNSNVYLDSISNFGPTAVASGDFNKDGKADFVTADWNMGTGSVWFNTTAAPVLGYFRIDNGATYARAKKVSLSISALDPTPGSYVKEMIISNNLNFTGANWESYTTSKQWNLSAGDGQKTVYIKFRDPVGNVSKVYSDIIILDSLKPSCAVTAPAYSSNISTGTKFTVSWMASDPAPSTGIIRYSVQYKIGLSGSWTGWLTGTALTSATFDKAGAGNSVYFRAVAKDKAGNIGEWSKALVVKTIIPYDNNSLITGRKGFDKTLTDASSKHYLGTLRYSNTANDEITYSFTGNKVALLSCRGSDRSKAKIYIDGQYKTTVDAYSSTVKYRQVLYSVSWSTVGNHTIKIINISSNGRTRFDIDGLAVGK